MQEDGKECRFIGRPLQIAGARQLRASRWSHAGSALVLLESHMLSDVGDGLDRVSQEILLIDLQRELLPGDAPRKWQHIQ